MSAAPLTTTQRVRLAQFVRRQVDDHAALMDRRHLTFEDRFVHVEARDWDVLAETDREILLRAARDSEMGIVVIARDAAGHACDLTPLVFESVNMDRPEPA